MAKAYVTPDGMRKKCFVCLVEMSLDRFHKCNRASDQLNPRCAACQSLAVKKCLDKKRAQGLPLRSEAQKKKTLERRRLEYKESPEKYKALTAEFRRLNPEKAYASSRAARAKRPGSATAYANEYYKKNSVTLQPKITAQTAKRYAQKVGATPAWADQKAILTFYQEAAKITAETGIHHHVDHIVPILSTKVCGLHVQHNLQILEMTANIRKGNRHWPDQP
jgi:hypothetical protein